MGKLKNTILDPKDWLEKKILLTQEDSSFADDRLRKSNRIGRAFENSINDWFDSTYKHTVTQKEISALFDNFYDKFTGTIGDNIASPKPSTFTTGLTPNLSAANTFTRSLSTKLGQVFEDIACLSSKVISPEKDFGRIKITGVDLLIVEKNSTEIIFSQLKTARGTLTGSQAPRSEKELLAHKKGIFSAALGIGAWTFKSDKVKRKSGSEFWELVGINEYEFILEEAKEMFGKLEDAFNSYLS